MQVHLYEEVLVSIEESRGQFDFVDEQSQQSAPSVSFVGWINISLSS
jgi:hypothetical protein